jgi:class 3 adenylate cyclase
MARPQLILVAALLALPLVGLAILLTASGADVHWQHNPSHFWLVLVTAGLNAALAYATGAAARRRGDRRVHLVSLAFLAASGFLALHALATPQILLDKPNLGFVIATPIGLALAGGLAALSALDRELVRPRLIEAGLLLGLAVWLVASLALFPDLDDVQIPDRLSFPLVALAAVGSVLYAFAVVRYVQFWRKRHSGLLLAFAVAFVLLAEAMVAVAVGRSWHASWWEWHVLMLVAFGLIAWAAHREWHEERFSPLYGDETAAGTQELSVLFADLQGFTAFSETREADEVGRVLNTLFDSAIPEIERHAGEIDRLIGDAVFARFTGDDHAERAARAALGLQKATAAVAQEHPGWPRFRAGVNTGEASVGVLGSGSGRTYSAIGDTVNLASRIEGLAPAGGVAMSAATAAKLLGAQTEPLGTVSVKGHAQPVEVLLLVKLPGS